jgi:hypothetical protein
MFAATGAEKHVMPIDLMIPARYPTRYFNSTVLYAKKLTRIKTKRNFDFN